jgi:hypothetical protein
MAIFQIQAKDAVVKFGQYPVINAVQSFDWEPSFNEEYFEELGNAIYPAQAITPEVSGSFELTHTGGTVSLLKRMIYSVTGGNYVGYRAGAANALTNSGTLYEKDLELAVFDLIENKKANEEFTRSTILPRAHLSTIGWSISADGSATTSLNFEGDMAEVYRGSKRDITAITQNLVRTSASVVTLTATAGFHPDLPGGTVPATTHTVEYLLIDDIRVDAADLTLVVTGTGATATYAYTVPAGVSVPAGARLMLLVWRKTPGTFPEIHYATPARFLRADDINIYLVPKSTVNIATDVAEGALNAYTFLDTDILLRVQSADINVDLRREALRQIRKNNQNTSVYYRAATYPLQVTASMSAFETDLEDWAKMQGKGVNDVLDLGGFEDKDWQIVVRFFQDDQVIETIAFLDARVSGRGARIQVSGRAEVNWSFTGSQLRIEGSELV